MSWSLMGVKGLMYESNPKSGKFMNFTGCQKNPLPRQAKVVHFDVTILPSPKERGINL